MFARQFADFMIVVLILAAGVAGVIGEPIEAAAILAIVLLNAILGFAQEWRAEQAMAALRALSAPRAQVIRDGSRQEIAAADLVAGDLVWLEAGTRVPADLRIIESVALRIEDGLTGDPCRRKRTPAPLCPTRCCGRNLAFCGTIVCWPRYRRVSGWRRAPNSVAWRLVGGPGEQLTRCRCGSHFAAGLQSRCRDARSSCGGVARGEARADVPDRGQPGCRRDTRRCPRSFDRARTRPAHAQSNAGAALPCVESRGRDLRSAATRQAR
jgi:Ca2+-transporting ATPase